MAANTCMSVIEYQNAQDILIEPFHTERNALSEQMWNEGKTEYFPNAATFGDTNPAKRYWVDHAAAQEFIDFVLLNASTYGVTIVSTSIEDL